MPFKHRRSSLVIAVGLFSLGAAATGEQAAKPAQPSVDGRVRSELSLVAHTAAVVFSPALRVDDPANRIPASAAPASADARVRVAQLETNGSLRLGGLALGKDDPAGFRYDLWLDRTGDAWQLHVTDVQARQSDGTAAAIGQVALSRRARSPASPTFVASLVPGATDAGRLVLRWSEHEATADVQFTDPPRRRQSERTPANVTTNRAHDEDTSALSRARLLVQRNETAFQLADGRRLSVTFARQGLEVSGRDFPRIASAENGVVELTESAVPRLRIEAPLRFGNATVRIGNQGPGFPGSYGIWLKRAGAEWRIVLNHEADAWGSQHDPAFDAVEIVMTHSEGHEPTRPFAVALVPTGANRGRLVVLWGQHEWAADFVVAS